MTTIHNNVRDVLRDVPATRNDYFTLWLEYIRRIIPSAYDDQGHIIPSILECCPSQHTIARIAAIIQNKERLYPPTHYAEALRRNYALNWVDYIRLTKLNQTNPGA